MEKVSSEALLECYYFETIKKWMLGALPTISGAKIRAIKPSTSTEGWVGFDQAWISTGNPTLTDNEFIDTFSEMSVGKHPPSKTLYAAHVLQFKRVSEMVKASVHAPNGISLPSPYWRADIDTNPSSSGSMKSQHERLCGLAKVSHLNVDYVLPMIFGIVDVFKKPDLNDLLLVKVEKSTPLYSQTVGALPYERHFIYLLDKAGKKAYYCSGEPTEANASAADGQNASRREWAIFKPEEVLGFLTELSTALDCELNRLSSFLPSGFTLFEIGDQPIFEQS